MEANFTQDEIAGNIFKADIQSHCPNVRIWREAVIQPNDWNWPKTDIRDIDKREGLEIMRCNILALSAFFFLASCQTQMIEKTKIDCGGNDTKDWVELSEPPLNAAVLSAIADANPNFRIEQNFRYENWYSLSDDEIMLCRLDELKPYSSCLGEWWQFDISTKPPSISGQDGWVCVT